MTAFTGHTPEEIAIFQWHCALGLPLEFRFRTAIFEAVWAPLPRYCEALLLNGNSTIEFRIPPSS